MRRNLALLTIITTLAVSSGASQALAQMDPGHRPQASDDMRARHEAHERQRAQDLRIILRLRPDQDAALAALLTHPAMGPMSPPPAGPLTTPQRMDQ